MLSRWTWLLRRLAVVLGLYTLLRLLFLACNHALFKNAPATELLLPFVEGLRFDISAIVATNFLFVLLTCLPFQFPFGKAYGRFLKGIFLLCNIPFLLLNAADLEYFQFTGRRSTLALIFMAGDAGVRVPTMLLYYWPLLFLAVILICALVLGYGPAPRSEEQPQPAKQYWPWLLNIVFVFPLAIIGFRGGFQYRPLSPAQAMPSAPGPIGQLALNSTFTLLKSYNKASLVRCHFFERDDQAVAYLQTLAGGNKNIPDEPRRDNLVIFILESFSAEYWGAANGGHGYTPFLDSLAGQSLFFPKNFANGRRSIEAAPSILAGLPSLMSESLLESVYQSNELLGLGHFLRPLGYTTSFFHGAQNGTMRFDTLARRAGIQRYYGLQEYPNKAADFDGQWGIYDEPYLQYVVRELSTQKPPFAATVFTLSSHHPYSVPAKYRGRFSKGTLAIHESIGYTDFALEQFFATARRQSWFSNTLFIITGDHTSKLEKPEYLNPLGQFRVPLLFYHPMGLPAAINTNRVTQQADILPSILDYLQIQPAKKLLFGNSIFRSTDGRAFLHLNGHYWLVRAGQALEFAPGTDSKLFDLANDPRLESPQPANSASARVLEKEAKALVQYFNNGMLDNKLYQPSSFLAQGQKPGR